MLQGHSFCALKRVSLGFMLWLVLLLTLACRAEPEYDRWTPVAFPSREQVASSLDALVSKFEPLERIRTRCIHSQGQWQPGLMSCLCPPHQIFNIDKGCQILALSPKAQVCASQFSTLPRDQIEQCMDNLIKMPTFDASVHLDHLTDTEIQRLTEKLDEDVASLFPGIAFFSENQKKSVAVTIQKLDRLTFNNYLSMNIPDRSLGLNFIFASPVLTPHVPEWNASIFMKSCKESLKDLISALGGTDLHENVCEAAAAMAMQVVHAPTEPSLAQISSRYTEEGQNCFNSCAVTMNFQRDDSTARYHILMHGYIPIVRFIEVIASTESTRVTAYFFLSPMGKFEAALAKYTRVNAPEDAFFVSSNECSLNDGFTAFECNRKAWGKKSTWMNVFENKTSLYQPPLPTDGRKDPVFERVHGLMIDDGIDVRISGLLHRVQINWHAVSKYLQEGTFYHNIISYPRHVLGHTMDMIDSWHGGAMASVIASDLPHVKLDFIPAMESCFKSDDPQWSEKWISYIKERKARVVNMSVTLSECITKCEALLGWMFQALPDVLFVVAVGNDGARDPIICPASIGPLYPNVLTVAGVDEQGQLHWSSNGGYQVAMVAAPFGGIAAEFGSTKKRKH